MHKHNPPSVGGQPGTGCRHRRCIPIQTQETPVRERSGQYSGRVSTPSHRCIYVPATRSDPQAIEHRLEKNRDVVDTLAPPLSLRTKLTSTMVRLDSRAT